MIREWKNRLRFLWRRRQFEDELDEEIRFHLETRVAELVAAGLPEREARNRARREFGSVAAMQEGSRMAWQVRWLTDFATDLRLALRGFRRNPGFAATAVLSLGLGLGATSAVFSMMDAALWRPLAVSEPERLVRLGLQRKLREPSDDLTVVLAKRLAGLPVFRGMLTATADGVSFEYDGRAERVIGEVVSPNYFEVLGVRPLFGQPFTEGTRSGRWAAEAVLSYRFWKTRFGGDPGVVGRTIRLNTYPFTIVGVSPPQFQGLSRGRDYEIQLPQLPDGQTLKELAILDGSDMWVSAMARLAPGVTAAQAEAAVNARLPELLSGQPISGSRLIERILLLPGSRGWVEEDLRGFRGPLYALLALVGLVLLIACANQASMLLARAAARQKELAVQCSIGAGRGRLMRQMMTESLALAVSGGLAGLVIAGPAGRLLFSSLPQGHLSLRLDIRTEGRVLLFTFGVAVATGLAVGLVPALQATRGNLALTLREQSGGAAARTRGALVALQATFCVAVLAAAGALTRGMAELRAPEYGGATARTLLFTMKPQNEIYSPERLARLFGEVVRRVSAVPGVRAAGLAENGPLGSRLRANPVSTPDGRAADADADKVTPGFFDLMGIAPLAGRVRAVGRPEGAGGGNRQSGSGARVVRR
jgi:predicted permease